MMSLVTAVAANNLLLLLLMAIFVESVHASPSWKNRQLNFFVKNSLRPAFPPEKESPTEIRGGSTLETNELSTHQRVERDPFQPPSVDLHDMALALRWTSEVNRRLMAGASRANREQQLLVEGSCCEDIRQTTARDPLRGGDGGTPTESWRLGTSPLSVGDGQRDSTLTLFHAKSPRKRQTVRRIGSSRWGPDLDKYLQHLVELLEIAPEKDDVAGQARFQLILTLAMVYLDRACSVETPRSNGSPPLPFCTPRTVHRLSLAALLVSVHAITKRSVEELLQQCTDSLGIPVAALQHMVDWMRASLGDPGVVVTPHHMVQWKSLWEALFVPPTAQYLPFAGQVSCEHS
jgi:hypothetical protein